MKICNFNIVSLVIVGMLLVACDPHATYIFELENAADRELRVTYSTIDFMDSSIVVTTDEVYELYSYRTVDVVKPLGDRFENTFIGITLMLHTVMVEIYPIEENLWEFDSYRPNEDWGNGSGTGTYRLRVDSLFIANHLLN